jgi:hypothetical protein
LAGLESGLSLQHEQSHVSAKIKKAIGLFRNNGFIAGRSFAGGGRLFDIGTLC